MSDGIRLKLGAVVQVTAVCNLGSVLFQLNTMQSQISAYQFPEIPKTEPKRGSMASLKCKYTRKMFSHNGLVFNSCG